MFVLEVLLYLLCEIEIWIGFNMSVSAKPAERAFESLLAVVLAVSLYPLMPAKEAQA